MCKTITMEDFSKQWKSQQLTMNIVRTVAYLIGTNEKNFDIYFSDNDPGLEALNANDDAVIIRNLCAIRTALMLNCSKVDKTMKYELTNLDRMTFYESKVKAMRDRGLDIIKANYSASSYLIDINKYIAQRIDNCKELFPDWITWKYIRNLFIMPYGANIKHIKKECDAFSKNKKQYPYSMYINGNIENCGNLLKNDKYFLTLLYKNNGDTFNNFDKTVDADNKVKTSIYDFIDRNDSVVISVDCENSDPYRLYAAFSSLDADELAKIKKIVLYDDEHTSPAWQMLTKEFKGVLEFEYILVDRIRECKSLVDHRMIAGISKEHYKDGVDAFIIVSSDSDYWSIIDTIDDAEFLVMVESEKVGIDIKKALNEKKVFFCYLNDFSKANVCQFESSIIQSEIEERIEKLVNINVNELLHDVYDKAGITPSTAEKRNYYNKFIKTLRLVVDQNGNMKISY